MSLHSLLDEMETVLRLLEPRPEDFEQPPLEEPRPGKIKLLACAFAVLAFAYHSQNALAEVISGTAVDGNLSISWEYDLEYGTGQLLIHNLAVSLEGDDARLYLAGLIPDQTEDLTFGPGLGMGCPPHNIVLAELSPGEQGEACFSFCDATLSAPSLPPCSLIQPVPGQQVEYGTGYVLSGVCFQVPVASLADFLTVRPVECSAPDHNGDGDVDLDDFAAFQRQFSDHIELTCYEEFHGELSGPH
jgi:hypothetical protein